MAASHRIPLMRDQWRVEEDYRDVPDRRESHYRDRRRPSPPRPTIERNADRGEKVKGRGAADCILTPQSRSQDLGGSKTLQRRVGKKGNHSPERRFLNSEVPTRNLGKSSEKSERQFTDRQTYQGGTKPPTRWRETRSPSSHRDSYNCRGTGRRSHSPSYSTRHNRQASRIGRRRERADSTSSSTRIRRYQSNDDNSGSTNRPARSSYIPFPSALSSSPPHRRSRNTSPIRQSSRSARRRHSPRNFSPSFTRPVPHRKHSSGRHRESASSTYHPGSQSKHTSSTSTRQYRQRQSPSRSPVESRLLDRNIRPGRAVIETESPQGRIKEMQSSTHPIQSILDENTQPPSPPQPIPSFDSDSHSGGVRETFSSHSMKSTELHAGIRPGRPQVDTRQPYTTSPQWTPTSSHHGSPQSGSPFSRGRAGWTGQQQHFHGQPSQNITAYSPSFRQNGFPSQTSPQGQYFPNNQPNQYNGPPQQVQPGFQNQPFRGGHAGYRSNGFGQGQDRRFSGPGAAGYGVSAPRGRGGHFQNLQWTASGGSRGRGQADPAHISHHQSGQSQSPPQLQQQQPSDQSSSLTGDDDNPFRPSKDLQVEDQSGKDADFQSGGSPGGKKMLPPSRLAVGTSQTKESSKFSFAFKSKVAPPAATKSVPDLAQKLKEPMKREGLLDNSKSKAAPRTASREPIQSRMRMERTDSRSERREDRRERDYRDDYSDERRLREERYLETHHREQRRLEYRDDRRSERLERDQKRDRERERSPEMRMEKKVIKRLKPPQTLPLELAESTSVYYRKPGNESVVGSGTYGKVFKAIHVYTKQLAALKKIRMEGEKDGFPVTAVREIKLLQSLKHDNVVCLQEVMVENNDCFMVFEYLSHDLTGLLNHPTFKLEHAHKKHLGKQLFEGLNYLHRRGVLHRDIKAANILVSNIGQLKLADFGLARFFSKHGQPDYTNRVITIWYRSPELLLGETQYGPGVDIWSAACVMIEIFTRHAIFPGDGGEINQLDKIYNVLGTPTVSDWPRLAEMAWFELLRPTERRLNTFAEKYQERLTPAAFELLQAMFLYDPSKRPTAGDVLEHPYFTTEDPPPRQALELRDLEGDWHEFESKALRKENERKTQEARRAVRQEEKDKEKRKASGSGAVPERDLKRARHEMESK